MQQTEHRKVRAGLSVCGRDCLQHHPTRLVFGLELVQKPRLADARLSDYCDDLAMPRLREFGGMLHCLHFALATYELGVTACRGALKTGAQRPRPGNLIDLQRLADPFDACRS